jgi:hypothetical protein
MPSAPLGREGRFAREAGGAGFESLLLATPKQYLEATMEVFSTSVECVVNKDFGAYNLSEEAQHAIAKRKGITLAYSCNLLEAAPVHTDAELEALGFDMYVQDGQKYAYRCLVDLPRTDKDLVAVVRDLGHKAHARDYGQLEVVTVRLRLVIEDNDGYETLVVERG